ncbi:hypothetical protein H310_05889 [Aphanomyces invadans]|uniref:Uncharacterized protein n=1 Tax=Aphanomyces invadans TaxID=157072 RepID=A0A024U821_9STRA|nr:hypothetical protein H310_05889 [Aphanomyces invadans]ETW02355.1 hypothetical protein H310_05889 [Aphanomyces invadans]|eukprot:XP_008868960.1 hypothetical protein H310_05889 [Aphanomyces invadans]
MEGLSISAVGVRRTSSSSHGSVGRSSTTGSSSRQGSSKHVNDSSRYKLSEGCSASDENNDIEEGKYPEPTKMHRPKEWSPEVEEAFRIQQTGWRDINDYKNKYGEPERWENGFIRCTRVKASGYYTYWRNTRECEDKHLSKVKVFEY